jgi:hypothetical protein
VTHLVFAAYQEQPSLAGQVAPNVNLLEEQHRCPRSGRCHVATRHPLPGEQVLRRTPWTIQNPCAGR